MADYLPLHHDGDGNSTPFRAGGTITGGQLVELSAPDTVVVAGAASTKVVGVAAYDVTSGQLLTTYRGGVQMLTASGSVAFGDQVVAAADGKVATSATPAAGTKIGKAQTAASDGERVKIRWEDN